ncbi:MAG: Na+/H+ antiporter NhaA [Rickettsiales bacterium]|nr:Na+/H+ antiporter NhaA [Rickettsiales bacterium]
MIKKTIKNFFELESATGILLFLATTLALIIANSSSSETYFQFLNLSFYSDFSLQDFVNDALMAIFFLLIGLELKKEVLIGHLSSRNKIALPAFAAIGGVIIPAIIFFLINFNHKENLVGFAIPTATDIAFAYGMLCLFGKKIPQSLKIFIVALAVLDDLAAILIIAIFYAHEIHINYLLMSLIPIFGLFLLNLKKSDNLFFYIVLGILLWIMILKSGIHSTLAGVILAMFIPLKINHKNVLENFAHKIAPVVNFLILSIFAFVNSGIKIANFSDNIFYEPLVLGIVLGMFLGKQIGVMLFSYVAIKLRLSHLPSNVNWLQFYAVAIFTGIGFTMSIFIGSIAFVNNGAVLDEVKLAIFIASLLSIIYGSGIVLISSKKVK